MKKKLLIIFLLAVIMLPLVFPYAKAEVLTFFHGEEFESLYQELHFKHLDYYKVVSYGNREAEVVYVGKKSIIIKVCYQKKDEWELDSWKCVWSSSGSADDLDWFFYRYL